MLNKSRETIIMNKFIPSRKTLVMDKSLKGITLVMGENQQNIAENLPCPQNICGYEITGEISENSGEATIYSAIKDGKQVVIKLYTYTNFDRDKILSLIKELKSEYLLTPIETGTYNNSIYEVLPLINQGNLSEILPLNEETIEKVVIPSIIEGLNTLHSKNIVHRDIKPENIFLNDDKTYAIIGDFGISSILSEEICAKNEFNSNTAGYASPELINGYVTKEADYYALGVTLLYLLLGHFPFEGMSDYQISFNTINRKLEIPDTVSPQMKKLIYGLTAKDRSERYGYEEVKNWLNERGKSYISENSDTMDIYDLTFNGQKFNDLNNLSLSIAQNWYAAKKYLFSGELERQLSLKNEWKAKECKVLKSITDDDTAIFKLIYILNPDAPLCFKGVIFNTLESLGKWMENDTEENKQLIFEFLSSECLCEYLENNQYDIKLIERINNISEEIAKGKSELYYALMYMLSFKDGYGENKINSIPMLIEFLKNHSFEEREKECTKMIYDKKFHMWLYSLGYEKQLEAWLDIYEKAEW